MENMFIFGLFLGNPHLKNEKKSQSADNKQNFEILVPLRAKHLKPHNNRLVAIMTTISILARHLLIQNSFYFLFARLRSMQCSIPFHVIDEKFFLQSLPPSEKIPMKKS